MLLDPRAKGAAREGSSTLAHPGGFQALDARGDTIITCGYGIRQGTPYMENSIKVC